ncbi:MAG: TolC family protein [Acidobacteriota bacterium]
MNIIKITVICLSLLAARSGKAEDSFDALAGMGDLLVEQHQHPRSSVPPTSLAELESTALTANPEIRLLTRRIAVAEAKTKTAGSREDPEFMYRGWGTPLQRPWDLNQTQHMFMYSQSLPGPGKRALRAEVANGHGDIAKAQLEAKKREITAQVRKAYYDLLRNQDELMLHDQQATLAKQGLEQARIKYVVGKVPQQDVLKAQVALTKLVEHLVMLQEEASMTAARLNTLLGRDPATSIAVEGKYAPPASIPSLLDLERIALDNRPELTAATAAIRQSEAGKKLADKGYSPDYNLSAGYMLMPQGSQYRNTYMAELSVTLPRLNKGRHEAEISEAQAEISAQQAEYEYQRSFVFQQIQEALVKAQSAKRLVDLYRSTLRPQAEAALKSAVSAYQTDRTDFLNLLESQNIIVEVELNYYRAAADLETTMADLELATGAPVDRQRQSKPAPQAQQSNNLSLEVR